MSNTLAKRMIGLWILRILMAALFLSAAFMKLTGQPMMVAEFEKYGFGQWFRYLTGSLELIGGIAILAPRLSPFAGILLLMVDVGAFVAQVTTLHGDWIHTVVIGLMLGTIIVLQRDVLLRAGASLSGSS